MRSLCSPHIVMVPTPAAGHSIPFLKFAKHLAIAGVTVTFVSTDRYISELDKTHRANLDSAPSEIPVRFLALQDGNGHLSHEEFTKNIRETPERARMVKLLEALVRDISSIEGSKLRGVPDAGPPACVMHDMFTGWTQEVAENLHIEKHLLFVSPMLALSIMLQSERLAREGRLPITKENRDVLISDIPGMQPVHPQDLPPSMSCATSYAWMRMHHSRQRKAEVVLGNTFYALESNMIDVLRNEVLGSAGVQTKVLLDIGPLLPESHFTDRPTMHNIGQEADSEERDPCIRWLNKQAPSSVIYICFGSKATHSASQLLELAAGLEESGQPFLWILRPPNSSHISGASGTPKSITEFLPPGFEERMKGRGMCYSGWVSQVRILRHPATGGFLSHCGWNSTLESVCAGVPMLAWSKDAEQHLNSRLLVSANLAIELRRGPPSKEDLDNNVYNPERFVTKEEITCKVRRLMQEEDEGVRKNMQEMKSNAREAVAPGGSSWRNFETYVQYLHTRASSAPQGPLKF